MPLALSYIIVVVFVDDIIIIIIILLIIIIIIIDLYMYLSNLFSSLFFTEFYLISS